MNVSCPLCAERTLISQISFGSMPIANGFLTRRQLDEPEFLYPLELGVCTNCHMAQLLHTVPVNKLFHENYAFFSSTSTRMKEYFGTLAADICEDRALNSESFAVEIGCNDGIFLEALHKRGVRCLGVEPSENVANQARAKGLSVDGTFFDKQTAERIRGTYGEADLVFGANVACHIPDLNDLFAAAKSLIHHEGIIVFEDPSLLEILRKNAYDQIYDEHVYYFSLISLDAIARRHTLKVIDIARTPTHGGCNRVTFAHEASKRPPSPRVVERLAEEYAYGLDKVEPFAAFADRCEQSRAELRDRLCAIAGSGGTIVGYAASSKGTIVLNYCGFGPETLDYIVDSTPGKQGLYSPGKHIPIVAPHVFHDAPPDYALLLAWNHAEEILNREQEFVSGGGKFLCHIPTVRVLGAQSVVS